jgi:hypothetical protein
MAAAAVVLLASHFEEYIRQQVEEYAKAVIDAYAHIEDDLKSKLIDAYWRCGSNKLARIRPRHDSDWIVGASGTLKSLIDYPVNGVATQFVARMISEHENNMRWDAITELFGRVGVKNLSGQLQHSRALRIVLDHPSSRTFGDILKIKLNDFYVVRNGIVHDISQNSGIGATIVQTWTLFFRNFNDAVATACENSYSNFDRAIGRKKAIAS